MNKTTISYNLALTCFILQFVLLAAGTFDRPDINIDGAWVIFTGLIWTAIKGIPWLVLIPGIIMKSARIMAWMSYVCLVYFIVWVLAVFSEQDSVLASLGVALTLIQFSAAAYYTRLIKNS